MTSVSSPAITTDDAEKRQSLPADLTSLDFLKAVAVVLMLTDHVGHYLLPDDLWLRAIGRCGFPLWFFMVGYAAKRDIPVRMIAGAVILEVANFITGMPLMPLNALFSMMAIKLTLNPIMTPINDGRISLWVVTAMLTVLLVFTTPFTEYGTMGLITAMFGYLVRHKDELVDPKIVKYFMVLSLAIFVVLQQIWFHFTLPQLGVVLLGTLAMRLCLLNLKKTTFPDLTRRLPRPLVALIQFMGRRTLEIYVAHLLVFKVIGIALGIGPHRTWFTLKWI